MTRCSYRAVAPSPVSVPKHLSLVWPADSVSHSPVTQMLLPTHGYSILTM